MKSIKNKKTMHRIRRHGRVRSQVVGTQERPRLSVFRSNKFIYAQLVDDAKGITLVATSDIKEKKGKKLERAKAVGTQLAKLASKKKLEVVVFDRGGFLYAGRVKALAEGARGGGLKF